jgi:hypothetical protein
MSYEVEDKYNSLGFIDPVEDELKEKLSSKWKLFFALFFTLAVLILLFASLTTLIVLDSTVGLIHRKQNYCLKGCTPLRYKNGAVATDNSLCSKVGADILKANGNAVDSIVATAFCQGVVSPVSSGIGGGGVLILYNSTTKESVEYDFRESSVESTQRHVQL